LTQKALRIQGNGKRAAQLRSTNPEWSRSFLEITALSLRPELLRLDRRFGYVETETEEFKASRPLRPGVQCHCIVMSKRL
jgi:hypothetical protein